MGTKENHFTSSLRLNMCEPVSATMAALAVMQTYQSQEAAEKQAQAQNDMYEQNQALQNEAYAKDMEAFYDKEVDMKLQDFKDAESAADAKLELQIEASQSMAAMKMANMSSAAGQSAGRSTSVLRRQLANKAFDIDDQLASQQFATRRDMKAMQFDKSRRHNSAVGSINSVAKAEYQDAGSRALGLITSGFSGYAMGQKMMAGSTTPDAGTTPSSTSTRNNLLSGSSRPVRGAGRGSTTPLYTGRGGATSARQGMTRYGGIP